MLIKVLKSAKPLCVLFEHISDEDNIREDCSDNGSINYCQISDRDEYPDIHGVHDTLEMELLADSENHNVSFERSNYFTNYSQKCYTSDEKFKRLGTPIG